MSSITAAFGERALDALGNATRRDIVRILATGPRPVGQIADELPVSRPAISKHLRILERARLVTFEAAGKKNVYRLRAEGFEAARDWFDGFWDDALARFALVAENTKEGEGA